ncbi:MAG: TIGR00730 family Rossman fold protein [Sphingomonadaceae bacterium]
MTPRCSICVFCASSEQIASRYFEQARELGQEMARRGHQLVYGGGRLGLMGAVARAVHDAGGRVIGVIPRRADWAEAVYQEADDLIYTATMRERKAIMEEKADAFLALPGGIGTLEELLEIITLRHLGYHEKPIVILDRYGYFDPLIEMLVRSIVEGFGRPRLRDMFHVATTVTDALHHIETYAAPREKKATATEVLESTTEPGADQS